MERNGRYERKFMKMKEKEGHDSARNEMAGNKRRQKGRYEMEATGGYPTDKRLQIRVLEWEYHENTMRMQ